MSKISEMFDERARLLKKIAESFDGIVAIACEIISQTLLSGGKIMLMGNGGSAADAQHIAAEFVGRFKKNRGAIPAISLTTDTSIITAIGNDFGFENIFSRQVEAIGTHKDVLIGISTSGNSINLIKGFEEAKKRGIKTIALLGNNGGKMKDVVDLAIIVPSADTPCIQEMQIIIGHIICEEIENKGIERI